MGNILPMTLQDPNALDKGLGAGNAGNNGNSTNIVQALFQADMADGKSDGSVIADAFGGIMDHLYLGAQGPTLQGTVTQAENKAQQQGLTSQQVVQNMTTGSVQALQNFASQIKNHPIVTGLSGAALAGAMATCPFLAGAGVAAGAAAMAGNAINNVVNAGSAGKAGN
jgi:hypothetical protein